MVRYALGSFKISRWQKKFPPHAWPVYGRVFEIGAFESGVLARVSITLIWVSRSGRCAKYACIFRRIITTGIKAKTTRRLPTEWKTRERTRWPNFPLLLRNARRVCSECNTTSDCNIPILRVDFISSLPFLDRFKLCAMLRNKRRRALKIALPLKALWFCCEAILRPFLPFGNLSPILSARILGDRFKRRIVYYNAGGGNI